MDAIIGMLIMFLGIALMLVIIFRKYALQIITVAVSIIIISVFIGLYHSYPSLVFAISFLGFALVIICYLVNKKFNIVERIIIRRITKKMKNDTKLLSREHRYEILKKDLPEYYKSGKIYRFVACMNGLLLLNGKNGDIDETPDLELMFEVYYSAFQESKLENLDAEFEKALEYLIMNYDSEFGYIQIINIINMQITNEESGIAPFTINSKKLCDMLEERINENHEILKTKQSKFTKNISAYENTIYNLEKLKSSCLKNNLL